MQNQTLNEFILLPVPAAMLEEAGISAYSLVQYSLSEGRITIEAVDDTGDYICDGDCESCPMSEVICCGDCKTCPCSEECDESEAD